MKRITTLLTALSLYTLCHGQTPSEHRFDPPWNTPPQSNVMFTIPGIDNVPDLFGDIDDPQLVVFFAGNQFMVMDSLITAFKHAYPQYQRVFVETLPPGILARQIEGGSITIGNMRITAKPDVFTDGRSTIAQKMSWFSDTLTYAYNNLEIMVRKGNPKNIHGWSDLSRKDIRISMPNPQWEGIGKRIEEAYVKAGGEQLRAKIMTEKVTDGSTTLTQIHHRQTPMRILYEQSDAGPVWSSEVLYQKLIGNPIEGVSIPNDQNVRVAYTAGILKSAPHAQAAKDFFKFLSTGEAIAIYKMYGFEAAR